MRKLLSSDTSSPFCSHIRRDFRFDLPTAPEDTPCYLRRARHTLPYSVSSNLQPVRKNERYDYFSEQRWFVVIRGFLKK